MNRQTSAVALILALALSASSATAQRRKPADASVELKLEPIVENGIFAKGQQVRIKAVLRTKSKAASSGSVSWRLLATGAGQARGSETPCAVPAEGDVILTHAFSPPHAGFFQVECRFESAGQEPVISKIRVGSDPEAIEVALTGRADLSEFWQATIAELGRTDPRYKTVRQADRSTATHDVYLVEMQSLGDACVRGWLQVPKKVGPHPAVLRVPGYGGNMRPVRRASDFIVFSFNVRGHGNSCDDIKGTPQDYWVRGLEDKGTYYYRGAYADCLRAVDYLSSRKDVDRKRIAVWGGSQGGGLSWMTAALDSRVTLCVSDIPWLCDWVNYFKLTDWPEMNTWVAKKSERTWKSTLETMSYFDTMNLASQIECPVLMGIGLQDQICPPSTSFATFNRIRGPKEYVVYPRAGHGLPQGHYTFAWQWIRRQFGMKHD